MATTTSRTFSLYISLSLLLLLSLSTTTASFSPVDHYLLNCGSRKPQTLDPDHRTFITDESLQFLKSTTTHTIHLQNDAVSSSLYNTARAFDRPARYVFPIKDRGTHHLVRLHFHPLFNNNHLYGQSDFHVLANGLLLLRNVRVPKSSSGDDDFPIIKEFVIPVDSDKVEITFMPSDKSKFAFVNAIEVISAPKDLIADVAQFVGSGKTEWMNGLLRNGFETVYRVNVGGFKVTPFNDSLWRTWVTDDRYLKRAENVEKVYFGGRINYQLGGASREVGPDNVYNTARVIKSLNSSVPNGNLTWTFEVVKGYRYMVRMHFCDVASAASGMLYFNVYVNGNLAYGNLDLSDITNRLLASPFYADFVVDGDSSGVLVVSVGPSNMSLPRAVDAILNGVEIWKLNNSMGSFDGEVCAGFVSRSWRRAHTGVLVPIVAAVFLLLAASALVQRRRSGNMGWSRLPMDVSEANLKSNQFSSIKA